MNDNKQFWQRFAGKYELFMKSSGELYGEICENLLPHLNKTMNVLELACGTGQLSFPLAAHVRLWEATDFSKAMIEQAKKKNASPRLLFSVCDATALPYANGSFDAVVISNALHIMPYPEQALREIRRVLKADGGLFAPTFVHGESIGYGLRVSVLKLLGFKVYHKWTAKEFAEFVSQHGFVVKAQIVMGSRIAPLCFLAAQQPGKNN